MQNKKKKWASRRRLLHYDVISCENWVRLSEVKETSSSVDSESGLKINEEVCIWTLTDRWKYRKLSVNVNWHDNGY